MDDNKMDDNELGCDGGEPSFQPQVAPPMERFPGPPPQRPGMMPPPMRPPPGSHDGSMGMRPPHGRFPPPVIIFNIIIKNSKFTYETLVCNTFYFITELSFSKLKNH